MHDKLKPLWELDAVELDAAIIDKSLSNFKQNVKFEDGKYTAKLPWKISHPNLPDNKQLAYKRIHSL